MSLTIDVIALGSLALAIFSWVCAAAIELSSARSDKIADPRAVSALKLASLFALVSIILMLARSAV